MAGEPEGSTKAGRADFAGHPVYELALRLCAEVLDLESKFPDDEQELIYGGLKRCAIETGSLIASGFGRSRSDARLDIWERARSRVMEARHLVLVARMRYLVDSRDVERFEALYFEMIEGLDALIGETAGEGLTGRAAKRPGRRR
ncbi:MAG TPA: four helix bundle protein [Candidatus Saccharimonadales bacterium]|nr:four helix bundle protein [Candidatus Saccharimonadales bacterium]